MSAVDAWTLIGMTVVIVAYFVFDCWRDQQEG